MKAKYAFLESGTNKRKVLHRSCVRIVSRISALSIQLFMGRVHCKPCRKHLVARLIHQTYENGFVFSSWDVVARWYGLYIPPRFNQHGGKQTTM